MMRWRPPILFALSAIAMSCMGTSNAFSFSPFRQGLAPTVLRDLRLPPSAVASFLDRHHESSMVNRVVSLRRSSVAASTSAAQADGEGDIVEPRARMVWLTGHGDMRLHDHGGFSAAVAAAAESNEIVVPVFVIDPEVHLRSRPESFVRRLHACLSALEGDIAALSSSLSPSLSPLVVRTGSAATVLANIARETNAVACHVIGDDVVSRMRTAQRAAVASLVESGVDVQRWTNCIRPDAPWSKMSQKQTLLPSFFPDYCKIADPLPTAAPKNVEWDFLAGDGSDKRAKNTLEIQSEGVPSLDEFMGMASSATPAAVVETLMSRPEYCITTEPYEDTVTENWCTERGARDGLEEYCLLGRDQFADKYFRSANIGSLSCSKSKSMYAQAAARILRENDNPSKVLALRETATRAFSSALKLGALSPKDVVDAAKNRSNNRANLFPSDDPLWGRSSEGSLHDVIEWREWFLLLAERSLSLQDKGEPATSGGEKMQTDGVSGDPREDGVVSYWRWKGQHLVRYITWPAGEDYYKQDEESRAPAILLVHGFAASAEQWGRLVHSLRAQTITENGKDVTPPIYAVDLLGFGHSEKPGLSYTQYLWESQLIDFAIEVMEAIPMVMAGNSIGGGISAGAVASLGKDIVRGLVLCNTAGILQDPDSYMGYENEGAGIRTYTEAALEGNPSEDPYAPVPLFGNKALDAFGTGIVKLIYPQIEDRLSIIYGNRMENADPAVVYAIQQGAASPGSANVIGSGQKLAPNRPLNEVLVGDGEGDGFPVLVVMGLDDRVSSPQVAKKRAELFSRLSPGKVVVEEIEDAGHCPHDDAPERVASAMLRWLPSCTYGT